MKTLLYLALIIVFCAFVAMQVVGQPASLSEAFSTTTSVPLACPNFSGSSDAVPEYLHAERAQHGVLQEDGCVWWRGYHGRKRGS